MILVVHELQTTLQQKLICTERTYVKNIRPHFYIHNNPSGSLKLQVLDNSLTLIQESNEMTIAEIKTLAGITEPYFHGYIRFDFDGFGLKEGDNFYVKLVPSGYTFSNSNFVGWCNDFDLRKLDAAYTPNDGYYAALDIQPFVSNTQRKGTY